MFYQGTLLLSFVCLSIQSKVILDEHVPKYQLVFGNDADDRTEPAFETSAVKIDGVGYECRFENPHLPEEAVETNESAPEQELAAAVQLVHSLGQHLFDDNERCLYFPETYWTYQFCMDLFIRQMRFDAAHYKKEAGIITGDGTIPNFLLASFEPGSFNRTDNFQLLERLDGSRYLSQVVRGGATCDKTGQERLVTVNYVCDEAHSSPKILKMREISTCVYEMTVVFNELCRSEIFMPSKTTTLAKIDCRATTNEVIGERINLPDFSLDPLGFGLYNCMPKIHHTGLRALLTSRYSSVTINNADAVNELLLNVASAFAGIVTMGRLEAPVASQGGLVVTSDAYEYQTPVYGYDSKLMFVVKVTQNIDGSVVAAIAEESVIERNFQSFNGQPIL